ncbi:MAG: hypothetical protein EAX86_06345 [Candidatus Heimdallarchaeota archaeon]|nr:hypothetical protein [Candidatus Heimdallarchaeota archaeon]
MGKYQDKIKEHFWMLVCDTIGETGNAQEFRDKYQSIFEIREREVIKLHEGHFWTSIHKLATSSENEEALKEELGSIVQIDTGKAKEHIWKVLHFAVGNSKGKQEFKDTFAPIFKINAKKALPLVEDQIWSNFYSIATKTKEPSELETKMDELIKLNTNAAAEMIKEVNPHKYNLLKMYK